MVKTECIHCEQQFATMTEVLEHQKVCSRNPAVITQKLRAQPQDPAFQKSLKTARVDGIVMPLK